MVMQSMPTRYNGSSYKFLVDLQDKTATRINAGQKVELLINEVILESRLELDCFFILTKFYPVDRIAFHQSVTLLPQSDFCSQENWQIDFVVYNSSNQPSLYLETKGIYDKIARIKTKMLASLCPDMFQKFLLVMSDKDVFYDKALRNLRRQNHAVAIDDLEGWLRHHQSLNESI